MRFFTAVDALKKNPSAYMVLDEFTSNVDRSVAKSNGSAHGLRPYGSLVSRLFSSLLCLICFHHRLVWGLHGDRLRGHVHSTSRPRSRSLCVAFEVSSVRVWSRIFFFSLLYFVSPEWYCSGRALLLIFSTRVAQLVTHLHCGRLRGHMHSTSR